MRTVAYNLCPASRNFCTLVHRISHASPRALHFVDRHIRTYIERAHDARFALIATRASIATSGLFSHNGILVVSLKLRPRVARFAMTIPLRRTVPSPHCTRSACSRPNLRKHRNRSLQRLTAGVVRALRSFRALSPYTRQAAFRTTRVRIRYNFRDVRVVDSGRRKTEALVTCIGTRVHLLAHRSAADTHDARRFAPLCR